VTTQPQPVSSLRSHSWSAVPRSPGVYWWYFPASYVDDLGIPKLCDTSRLRLRYARDGRVCLYHGLAKDLRQRIAWHAAQKLLPSALNSGFLSTFRLTLLALNDFEYLNGGGQIDNYFDSLSIAWLATGDLPPASRTSVK